MKRKLFAVSMAAAMATSCFAGTAFASDSEPVTIKVTRACFNLANPDSEQVKKVQVNIPKRQIWHLQTMRLTCFGQLHGNLPLEQMI